MSLNIFDIGIFLIFLMFIIIGWKKGVVKETTSFIGIILVFFLSYSLKGIVGNLLCSFLPFFEFSGSIEGLVSLNILIYHLIALILLFSIFMAIYRLLLKISNTLQKLINYTIILIIPSKILGAIIALIEGWVITFIILVVLIIPFKNIDLYQDSKMVNIILFETPILSDTTKPLTQGTIEIYDVTTKIANKKISTNEANLETIDIMLKYKLVDKKTVKKLVDSHKIDSIEGIEKLLEKY